jgi:hypothetical protein
LTILATVLAGISSSEMIQAQYHRSLAAQNQSKAGDQWAFFQAKRTRNTIITRTLDLFAGSPQPISPRRDVQTALTFLGNESLPPASGMPKPVPAVEAALGAFADHRPETEWAPLVNAIDDAALDREVSLAEQSAGALENAGKSVDSAIHELDEVNRQAMRMVHSFHRGVTALDDAVAGLAAGGAGETVRAKALEIGRIDHDLARALDHLRDYHAAREDYAARRMDREATANRSVAGLYELRVEKSTLNSERHRRRSKNFFYGMLCAQAGVAMSSFALAARHRSGFWSLAGMAGLAALIFSGYVYLYI